MLVQILGVVVQLIGQLKQVSIEVRCDSAQGRQYIVTQPRTQIVRVAIAGIVDGKRGDKRGSHLQERVDLRPRDGKQGSQQANPGRPIQRRLGDRLHARQAARAGACQPAHQHGLGLVIAAVAKADPAGAQLFGMVDERGIASRPRLRLPRRPAGHRDPQRVPGKSQTLRHRDDIADFLRRTGSKLMIDAD